MSDLEDMVDKIFGDDFDEKFEEQLGKTLKTLRQRRDELKLKIKLATADARDEWENAEKEWHHLAEKLKVIRDEGKETTNDVVAKIKIVGEEISQGYERIKKRL